MKVLTVDEVKEVDGALGMGEAGLALIALTFAAPMTIAGAAAFGIGMGVLAMHTYYSSV